MKPAPKLIIRQPAPPEPEVATEVIADAIVAISDGIRRLRSGRLNDRALIMLIKAAAPGEVRINDVKAVLAGIENLKSTFLRKG